MARHVSKLGPVLALLLVASPGLAQTSATPPADLAQTVTVAVVPGAPPAPPPPVTTSTNGAVSAGGQFATGNSRFAALTGTGKMDIRRGANAFAAAIIGNYAESYVVPAPTPVLNAATGLPTTPATYTQAPGAWKESTENLQGRVRYDRYFTQNFSGFLQLTALHDAFQAITFRLNVDPGVKLLVVNDNTLKLWGEAGYDFQFDDNYTDGNGIEQSGAGGQLLSTTNSLPYVIKQNDTIHSGRLFAGFQLAFNKEVQLSMGLEYLQGFGGSGSGLPSVPQGYGAYTATPTGVSPTLGYINPVAISLTGSRVNFDVLLAANVGAGLAVGVGFSAKYNSAPLAGKEDLDTATTLTLIYSFSGSAPKKEEKKPPACVVDVTTAPASPAPPAAAPAPPAAAPAPPVPAPAQSPMPPG